MYYVGTKLQIHPFYMELVDYEQAKLTFSITLEFREKIYKFFFIFKQNIQNLLFLVWISYKYLKRVLKLIYAASDI